jgi:hypothetical protein
MNYPRFSIERDWAGTLMVDNYTVSNSSYCGYALQNEPHCGSLIPTTRLLWNFTQSAAKFLPFRPWRCEWRW